MKQFSPDTVDRPDSVTKRAGGFTLVELLAVVAIILVLLALLFPALSGAREAGRGAVCLSNVSQLSKACLLFAADNIGYFPWAGGIDRNLPQDWIWGGQQKADTENKAYWENPPSTFGFHAEGGSIFPYVTGQAPIRPNGKCDETITTTYPQYRCPSTGKVGESIRVNYSMNDRIDSHIYDQNSPSDLGVLISHVQHPAAKVLLVNEDPRTMHNASLAPMGSNGGVTGNNDAYDGGFLNIMHNGGINISFMDGHGARVMSDEFHTMQKNIPRYFDVRL